GLEAEVVPQRVGHLGPSLRKPVLFRLARCNHDRRGRPLETGEELPLPGSFVRPWADVPLHRLPWHAELAQELEVLILDVLIRVWRNPAVGEQPIEVARAGAIEAELHRRARQR